MQFSTDVIVDRLPMVDLKHSGLKFALIGLIKEFA